MKIIIGLGNPGKKYENTRHNAGWLAIDDLAKKHEASWTLSKKLNAEIARYSDILLVKPQTFMNNSGQSVRAVLDYYKIDPSSPALPDDLIVIHDDLDIESGEIKRSVGSRSAGHNGVQSIIDHLGTKNFTRLRIGIKPQTDPDNPEAKLPPSEKYVLARFAISERTKLKTAIEKIVEIF